MESWVAPGIVVRLRNSFLNCEVLGSVPTVQYFSIFYSNHGLTSWYGRGKLKEACCRHVQILVCVCVYSGTFALFQKLLTSVWWSCCHLSCQQITHWFLPLKLLGIGDTLHEKQLSVIDSKCIWLQSNTLVIYSSNSCLDGKNRCKINEWTKMRHQIFIVAETSQFFPFATYLTKYLSFPTLLVISSNTSLSLTPPASY